MPVTSPEYGLKALLGLAWPVVVARSSQAVVGFSDALMSAPLGEASLAAVTTGAMNAFSVTILPLGIVFVAQSFAAQLYGQGRMETAVRFAWYAMLLAAATQVGAAAAVPLVSPGLALFGYEPEVERLMTTYLEIRLLGIGAVVATEALGSWYGGLGNTRLHMAAGMVTMVANILLNWVLIFGHLGAPALGVTGAAIASVAAGWIGFGTIAALFALRVAVPAASVRPRGLRLAEVARLLRFGIPHGLNWFFEFAAFSVFINVVVAGLGTTVLAAMMVVMNVNSLSFMPAFGVASAGAILSGQAIGRGELHHVRRVLWRTLGVAIAWQSSVGLLYVLTPKPVMALFAGSGAESAALIETGALLLAMSAAWQMFDAAGITLGEALRSAGDTAWVLAARLVIAWLLFTPAAFYAVRCLGGGSVAAILCVIGYLGALALVLAWRFYTGAWKRINLTGVEPQLVS